MTLQKGDCIGIFGISNHVERAEVEYGMSLLESWGLKPRLAENLFKQCGRYDGTLQKRIDATQALLDDPSIKALIATRGGYGAAQVVPALNLESARGKLVIGYSDVTVLHAALAAKGIPSLHGPMLRNIGSQATQDALHKALFEGVSGISTRAEADGARNNIPGTAVGRLVGGNLALIYSLLGTPLELDTRDAILFLEDVDESAYSVDRMLQSLSMAGKLSQIKGLMLGQFTGFCGEPYDMTLPEIIRSKVSGIPVLYGIPAGHDWDAFRSGDNLPLLLGSRIKMIAGPAEGHFEYL